MNKFMVYQNEKYDVCYLQILEKSTEEEIDNSDNVSEISNLSGLSEESWKPTSGKTVWISEFQVVQITFII